MQICPKCNNEIEFWDLCRSFVIRCKKCNSRLRVKYEGGLNKLLGCLSGSLPMFIPLMYSIFYRKLSYLVLGLSIFFLYIIFQLILWIFKIQKLALIDYEINNN